MGMSEHPAKGEKPLTGKDYMERGVLELQSHPDYSAHAMRVIVAISKMNTKQLESLPIVRGI